MKKSLKPLLSILLIFFSITSSNYLEAMEYADGSGEFPKSKLRKQALSQPQFFQNDSDVQKRLNVSVIGGLVAGVGTAVSFMAPLLDMNSKLDKKLKSLEVEAKRHCLEEEPSSSEKTKNHKTVDCVHNVFHGLGTVSFIASLFFENNIAKNVLAGFSVLTPLPALISCVAMNVEDSKKLLNSNELDIRSQIRKIRRQREHNGHSIEHVFGHAGTLGLGVAKIIWSNSPR
jgi:hypothetical protein